MHCQYFLSLVWFFKRRRRHFFAWIWRAGCSCLGLGAGKEYLLR